MTLKSFTSPLLSAPGVSHGFFTRQGGVSKGIYASLNCGPGSADDPAAVRENRARVSRRLLGREEQINTLYQIHSPSVIILDKPMALENRVKADGLVTGEPGLILGVLTADCAPVLFSDPVAKIIGAAHAGWRGALDGVLENVVAKMVGLGSKAENIRAAVGPAIGVKSYEVGDEFRAEFMSRSPGNRAYFKAKETGKFLFDLERFCKDRLRAAGVGEVDAFALDTYAGEEDFFSYRRAYHRAERDYGRQVSAIALI